MTSERVPWWGIPPFISWGRGLELCLSSASDSMGLWTLIGCDQNWEQILLHLRRWQPWRNKQLIPLLGKPIQIFKRRETVPHFSLISSLLCFMEELKEPKRGGIWVGFYSYCIAFAQHLWIINSRRLFYISVRTLFNDPAFNQEVKYLQSKPERYENSVMQSVRLVECIVKNGWDDECIRLASSWDFNPLLIAISFWIAVMPVDDSFATLDLHVSIQGLALWYGLHRACCYVHSIHRKTWHTRTAGWVATQSLFFPDYWNICSDRAWAWWVSGLI